MSSDGPAPTGIIGIVTETTQNSVLCTLHPIYFEIFFFGVFHSSDAPCMPTAVCVFLITLFFFFLNKGKREFHPNDLAISKSLEASGRIYVYRKDLADTLVRTFSLALETHGRRCQTENILVSVL